MRLTPIFFAVLALADDRATILERMDARVGHFVEISRQIWELAEVGYKEHKSSAILQKELRDAGFQVDSGVAGMPTGFVASWGSGQPVIGILGEFDALPGLSQESISERKPRVSGGAGHGCGHNLFGAASAFAAVAVKQWMSEKKIPGTIRFYGTPAEEGGGGKVYMARAGLFKDVSAVLAWHPGGENRVSSQSSLANISGKFRFHGKPAHASGAPHLGRSALDGLILMTHAVDMLREHVPAVTRIHYVITNGGAAPNVVPEFSEGYFYARHPEMPVLDGIWDRIIKCAGAGALATDTKVEVELTNSVWNTLPNPVLGRVLERNLRAVGGVKYSAAERSFAEALRKTFEPTIVPIERAAEVLPALDGPSASQGGGSTDVGDVSWTVPTAQFTAATYVPGTPGHSWQSTACSGMSIGQKGMAVAAKTLALSMHDLFLDSKTLAEARAAFDKQRAGHDYRSRIPAGQGPPLTYRDK